MKITLPKNISKTKYLMVFAILMSVFVVSSPHASAAPSATELCKDKQASRVSKCEASVKSAIKKCSKKKGSAKTKCENDGAKKAAGAYHASSSKSSEDSSSSGLGSGKGEAKYQCGTGDSAVKTKFDLGCQGEDYSDGDIGPIQDLFYSIIRFLSAGVGLLVVASIIYAGIQYSSSQGNPEETQAAKGRVQNSVIALVIYMLIFALVQYLVPGGLFSIITTPSAWVDIMGKG